MKQIPMLDLQLEYEHMKQEIDEAISKCMGHQRWIQGPEVSQFEREVSQYLGVRHCVGVGSGTDALVISLRALAIKLKGTEYFEPGDEIITTPFTFTATGDAIRRSGATPVFVDIDPATFNIHAAKVQDYLTAEAGRKVKGIVAVHLYGQACDMDELTKLAKEHNLFVVEDVAQAFGGRWREKKLGAIGDAGAFSFFPSKNLGGFGDGGMIATDDEEIAELSRMLLKHGGRDKYDVEHIGYNSRLDTIQAAILSAKLKYVEEFNESRRRISEIYMERLSGIDAVTYPMSLSNAYHVYHQYTVRIADDKRNDVRQGLAAKGIATAVYYPVPLHKMKLFKDQTIKVGQLEESEKAATEVLSLPVEPLLAEEKQLYICQSLRELC